MHAYAGEHLGHNAMHNSSQLRLESNRHEPGLRLLSHELAIGGATMHIYGVAP